MVRKLLNVNRYLILFSHSIRATQIINYTSLDFILHLTEFETVALTRNSRTGHPLHLTEFETVALTRNSRTGHPLHLAEFETVALTRNSRTGHPLHLTEFETVTLTRNSRTGHIRKTGTEIK